MVSDDAIYREVVRLRRGRALQAARLRARVGPRLSAVSGVQDGDPDRVIRQKVTNVVHRLTGDFPSYLRLAINIALAIDRRAPFPKLEDRESWLAETEHCSSRTARRRVEDASVLLAEALRQRAGDDRPPDPEQGWYVSHLSTLLCLDSPAPELYEERTIVATRDGLDEIRTRASLPRVPGDDSAVHELDAKLLHGARLRAAERLGDTHFRHTLSLPRVLRQGETHSYTIKYELPSGQPMCPHFAFVPLAPCESFQLRIRFDRKHPPELLWRLDRVAPRLLDEQPPGVTPLALDEAGDLSQSFSELVQGYGYGIGWRPPGRHRGTAR